jgi:hypothetical protein
MQTRANPNITLKIGLKRAPGARTPQPEQNRALGAIAARHFQHVVRMDIAYVGAKVSRNRPERAFAA